MARRTRTRTVQPQLPDEEFNSTIPMDPVIQAQLELDTADEEVEKIKTLILQLRDTDPDEELTISIRTRIAEYKPWYVLSSRKVPIQSFDLEQLITEVQNENGDGNYKLVMYLRGRVIRQYEFHCGDPRRIQREKESPSRVPDTERQDLLTILPVIMKQSSESSSQMMGMLMAVMQESRASSDRMMQVQMNTMGMIIPALVGGKADPTELMAKFATLFKELQPPPQTNGGMNELLDNAVKIKALIGGGEGGGRETNAFDLLKEAAPAIAAALPSFLPQQVNGASPGNNRQISAPQLPPTRQATSAIHLPSPQPETSPQQNKDYGDPILNLIGEDVLFFARRGYAAEIAANTITDKLDHAGITLEQLQAHFGEWVSQGDWLENLANRGLDLRQYREWAATVVQYVLEQLGSTDEGDDTGGEGGSKSDNASNVAAG